MGISQLYVLSFCIYMAVSIFTFMLYGAMPALFAKVGLPPQYSGYLYISLLPFMISFLYASFIESYRKKSSLAFKWLVCLAQCLLGLCFFALAFLDLYNDFIAVFCIFILMSFICSFSIVALNGVSIEESSSSQKAKLNAVMLIASGVGGVIGIMLCLILCEYFSFAFCFCVLGVIVILSSIPLFALHYPLAINLHKQSVIQSLMTKVNWYRMFILIMLIFPLTLSISMSSALLVYIGFDLQIVGILSGILNCLALLVASPLAYALIRRLGLLVALRIVLLGEMILFVLLSMNMQIWQSHFVIVCGLFLAGLCFGAQFIFCYTIGMQWCEDSTQSGVDFAFLRMSENAAFIIAGVLASQILGIFISNFENLHHAEQYTQIPITLFFSYLLAHNGVDSHVGQGYMWLFGVSAMFLAIALYISKNITIKE